MVPNEHKTTSAGHKDLERPCDEMYSAQNNDIQTLADLLQRPVPNRDIKDFEE